MGCLKRSMGFLPAFAGTGLWEPIMSDSSTSDLDTWMAIDMAILAAPDFAGGERKVAIAEAAEQELAAFLASREIEHPGGARQRADELFSTLIAYDGELISIRMEPKRGAWTLAFKPALNSLSRFGRALHPKGVSPWMKLFLFFSCLVVRVLPMDGKAREQALRELGRPRPAADRFETLSWTSQQPVSLSRLQAAIGRLAPKLARAKGLFESVEQPGKSMVFQFAGGRATLAPGGTRAVGTPRTRIVFVAEIGVLSRAELDGIMQGCIEAVAT